MDRNSTGDSGVGRLVVGGESSEGDKYQGKELTSGCWPAREDKGKDGCLLLARPPPPPKSLRLYGYHGPSAPNSFSLQFFGGRKSLRDLREAARCLTER